jgi:NAD(P)-dependent dehydrogenase (short-subunit alcohol dehydrogenase family)
MRILLSTTSRGRVRAFCAYDAGMLKDKIAIISGVGKGLGRELALAFSREGAKVALGARTKSYVEEVAAEVRERGGQAIAIATDITAPIRSRSSARTSRASSQAPGST